MSGLARVLTADAKCSQDVVVRGYADDQNVWSTFQAAVNSRSEPLQRALDLNRVWNSKTGQLAEPRKSQVYHTLFPASKFRGVQYEYDGQVIASTREPRVLGPTIMCGSRGVNFQTAGLDLNAHTPARTLCKVKTYARRVGEMVGKLGRVLPFEARARVLAATILPHVLHGIAVENFTQSKHNELQKIITRSLWGSKNVARSPLVVSCVLGDAHRLDSRCYAACTRLITFWRATRHKHIRDKVRDLWDKVPDNGRTGPLSLVKMTLHQIGWALDAHAPDRLRLITTHCGTGDCERGGEICVSPACPRAVIDLVGTDRNSKLLRDKDFAYIRASVRTARFSGRLGTELRGALAGIESGVDSSLMNRLWKDPKARLTDPCDRGIIRNILADAVWRYKANAPGNEYHEEREEVACAHCGGPPETRHHMWWECPKWTHIRTEHGLEYDATWPTCLSECGILPLGCDMGIGASLEFQDEVLRQKPERGQNEGEARWLARCIRMGKSLLRGGAGQTGLPPTDDARHRGSAQEGGRVRKGSAEESRLALQGTATGVRTDYPVLDILPIAPPRGLYKTQPMVYRALRDWLSALRWGRPERDAPHDENTDEEPDQVSSTELLLLFENFAGFRLPPMTDGQKGKKKEEAERQTRTLHIRTQDMMRVLDRLQKAAAGRPLWPGFMTVTRSLAMQGGPADQKGLPHRPQLSSEETTLLRDVFTKGLDGGALECAGDGTRRVTARGWFALLEDPPLPDRGERQSVWRDRETYLDLGRTLPRVILQADGGSRATPGVTGYGAHINQDGAPVWVGWRPLPNSESAYMSEWAGLMFAFEKAEELVKAGKLQKGGGSLSMLYRGDNATVIAQAQGLQAIRVPPVLRMAEELRAIRSRLRGSPARKTPWRTRRPTSPWTQWRRDTWPLQAALAAPRLRWRPRPLPRDRGARPASASTGHRRRS